MNAGIDWTSAHTRGVKLIIELLRDRWRHATMYALCDGPLQPKGVEEVFRSAKPRNVPVFGPHLVTRDCVTRHLSELLRGGLLDRRVERGASSRTLYFLNPLSSGLLEAIVPAARFGAGHYRELVEMSRERFSRSIPPAPVDVAGMTGPARVFLLRRCAALVFGMLLAPRWTLAVLAALAAGPRRTTDLTADVNAVIAENDDWLTAGSISRPTVHAQLVRLVDIGYVERGPGPAYALTEEGRELLEALVPAAQFGIDHDAELVVAVRALARSPRGKGQTL